jgi:hypothetical protein
MRVALIIVRAICRADGPAAPAALSDAASGVASLAGPMIKVVPRIRAEDRSCGLLSFLRVPGEAQASMSAQMFLAQPKATLPSISLRAADTPPAPLTGCTTLLAGSYWCTEVTWMAFFASTKL